MTQPFYIKKVEQGQDVIDLTLQEYGDIVALFLLLEDNPSFDVERELSSADEAKFRNSPDNFANINKRNLDFMRQNNILINTQNTTL
jgi:hypothetical protein